LRKIIVQSCELWEPSFWPGLWWHLVLNSASSLHMLSVHSLIKCKRSNHRKLRNKSKSKLNTWLINLHLPSWTTNSVFSINLIKSKQASGPRWVHKPKNKKNNLKSKGKYSRVCTKKNSMESFHWSLDRKKLSVSSAKLNTVRSVRYFLRLKGN
jgi:hypothetical protein